MKQIPDKYPEDLGECLEILKDIKYESFGFPHKFLNYSESFGYWSFIFRNPRNFSNPKIEAATPLEACHKTFDFLKELENKDENAITGEPKFYIQNDGYSGNALIWWRHGGKGYSPNIMEAGRFTEEEAKGICKRDEDNAWPVDYLNGAHESHQMIINSQLVDYKMRKSWDKSEKPIAD